MAWARACQTSHPVELMLRLIDVLDLADRNDRHDEGLNVLYQRCCQFSLYLSSSVPNHHRVSVWRAVAVKLRYNKCQIQSRFCHRTAKQIVKGIPMHLTCAFQTET